MYKLGLYTTNCTKFSAALGLNFPEHCERCLISLNHLRFLFCEKRFYYDNIFNCWELPKKLVGESDTYCL